MSNPVARKRHIKKVLDRWENEGGNVRSTPSGEAQDVLRDEPSDKGDAPSAENSEETDTATS